MWCMDVCKTPEDISGATKGQTQCYQTEKGSLILDAAAWTDSYLWKEGGTLSLLLLFFPFFLLLSLLLTVFDCIRQVNEKQHRRNDWQPFVQPAPAAVYVCVCIPASAYVWLSRVLRRASQSTRWWDCKRVMRSSSIPSGWGPFCRRDMVMKTSVPTLDAVKKLRAKIQLK